MINASNLLSQADSYENNKDYTNAIIMRQKASEEISNALKNYNSALKNVNSDYTDYLTMKSFYYKLPPN